jgi:hypothetical protein
MGLHPEVPTATFLCRTHFRVTRTRFLGRAGHLDQRSVDGRTRFQRQALGLQEFIDRGEHLRRQFVRLQQVAKPQDRAFIGQARHTVAQLREFSVKRDVVEGLFHHRIRQTA